MSGLPVLVEPGWTVAACLGAAATAEHWRWRRRRSAANRALHELRRPLQGLALAGGQRPGEQVPVQVELAALALADLERVLNGGADPARMRVVRLRPLVEGVGQRWRFAASGAGGSVTVAWEAGEAWLYADPARVNQALDNLLENAIKHGGGDIAVEVAAAGRRARITVRDQGLIAGAGSRSRGYGLAVVAEVAASHDGRFFLDRGLAGGVAVLELPIARPDRFARAA